MHEIELRAKSLEEARKAAAFQLGVSPEEVEIEVLEEPRGLMAGLLGGTYRIRARIKPQVFSPGDSDEGGATEEEHIDVSRFTLSGGAENASAGVAEDAGVPAAGITQAAGEPNQQVAENAKRFLDGLMDVWGLNAGVEIRRVEAEEVELELVGQDLAILIGRYGSTLDALQILTAAAANRGVERGARVSLDAEDYRQRRRESLERLARSTAAKVKRTGHEIALRNLRPHERRIIHLALRDDPDVETYSEGEGTRRRLIVAPRRRRRPRRGR